MKVRVKEGEIGFYGGKLRHEGNQFTLVERKHSTQKDSKGEPLTISAEQQFSKRWMEVVDSPVDEAVEEPAEEESTEEVDE